MSSREERPNIRDKLTEEEVDEFLREVVRQSGLICERDLPDIPSGRKMSFRITEGMIFPKERSLSDLSDYK